MNGRWRSDLKWVFGIPFTISLAAFLLVLTFFQFTSDGEAQRTINAMNQPVLAQPQLMRDLSLAAPDLSSFLTSPDFAAQAYNNPSLLKQKIDAIPDSLGSSQTAAAGAGGGESQTAAGAGIGVSRTGDSQGSGIKAALGVYSLPVAATSGGVHRVLRVFLFLLLGALVLFGAPFICFSRGLGRLVSAGVSFAVASWVPLFWFMAWNRGLSGWISQAPAASGDQRQLLSDAMRPWVGNFLGEALSVYRLASFLALVLLVAAGVAALALRDQRRPDRPVSIRESAGRAAAPPPSGGRG